MRRLSRTFQPNPEVPDRASQEKIPAPSSVLMDHLWDTFGGRPALEDVHGRVEIGALVALARQEGREQILNYLQELIEKGHPENVTK